MENNNKSKAGLWIDHRKAVIVIVSNKGEETIQIDSGINKRTHFVSGTTLDNSTEDVRDRQFENHLHTFYNDVIGHLREVGVIQIFGPGEAKVELEARLINEGFKEQIVSVENADKMTDRQITAKVRQLYKK
jgi:hypothetical protein